jgi:citrate/tricarballylate utilization protein
MPAADLPWPADEPPGPAAGPPRPALPTDALFAQAAVSVQADLFAEARRQLSVCNACRYCAGYCPVWPELELRTDLSDGDLGYLASLCHDCQDCYTACMYTAPHEFALNPPQVFAGLREDTYRRYAWPRRLPGRLAGWPGTAAALVAAAALLVALSAATGRLLPGGASNPAGPYQVVPYALLLALVGVPALWCAAVLAAGAVRYWRDIHGPVADLARPLVWAAALVQAARLRHMRGGEAGCDYPGDEPSAARRRFHLTLVSGFGLCLVSTVSAAVEQDLLGISPPYAYPSVPVAAGTLGGIGMIAGGAGLLALKARSHQDRGTPGMRKADYAFTAALLVLAASGLLTLAVRDTAAFGPVLVAHLAAVMVAFAIAPYTKFAHWTYRLLAIYKSNLDALSR